MALVTVLGRPLQSSVIFSSKLKALLPKHSTRLERPARVMHLIYTNIHNNVHEKFFNTGP
jgi:hypothetical protein